MEQIRQAAGSHGSAGTLINTTGSFPEARGCISVAVDCRQVIVARLELSAGLLKCVLEEGVLARKVGRQSGG